MVGAGGKAAGATKWSLGLSQSGIRSEYHKAGPGQQKQAWGGVQTADPALGRAENHNTALLHLPHYPLPPLHM